MSVFFRIQMVRKCFVNKFNTVEQICESFLKNFFFDLYFSILHHLFHDYDVEFDVNTKLFTSRDVNNVRIYGFGFGVLSILLIFIFTVVISSYVLFSLISIVGIESFNGILFKILIITFWKVKVNHFSEKIFRFRIDCIIEK